MPNRSLYTEMKASEWVKEVPTGTDRSGATKQKPGVKRLASEPQPGYSQTRTRGQVCPGCGAHRLTPLGDLPQSEVSVLLCTEGAAAQSGNHCNCVRGFDEYRELRPPPPDIPTPSSIDQFCFAFMLAYLSFVNCIILAE